MAAIGLIETRGLVGVIEAADAAVKSAPVELLGIKPIGGGLVSTHFRGEVAAVQVAVQAGVEAALKVSQVISHRVIPAPHLDIENLLLH
ncbi:MAG: BMC domain-containing protein, partial [Gemmatimonadetes bacterium]|nr:BMC domain-containing protein [Gemmatimonadota bacterium]